MAFKRWECTRIFFLSSTFFSSWMLIPALFTINKCWKQPECRPPRKWTPLPWCAHVMGYYLAVKRSSQWTGRWHVWLSRASRWVEVSLRPEVTAASCTSSFSTGWCCWFFSSKTRFCDPLSLHVFTWPSQAVLFNKSLRWICMINIKTLAEVLKNQERWPEY